MDLEKALLKREENKKKFLKLCKESEDQKKIYQSYKKYKKAHNTFLALYEKEEGLQNVA